MDVYSWIISNKEIVKIFYALIIVIVCTIIVFRTDKLFKLSLHNGIRYFRNAFFFYGIAFIFRYFIGSGFIVDLFYPEYYFAINILFEFFLIMAGFFLLYSLMWRRFENEKGSFSSLFNVKILVFYLMAITLVLFDFFWATSCFMFLSQIILFFGASIMSYINYKKGGSQRKFSKFHFVAMILVLFGWVLNFLAALYFNWNPAVLINVYIFNMIFFLIFLYGVARITRG